MGALRARAMVMGRVGALVVTLAVVAWAVAPVRTARAFTLPAYNSEGVAVSDGISTYAGFGGFTSYSGTALAAAGLRGGAIYAFSGANFQMAPFIEGASDHWRVPAASPISIPLTAPAGSLVAFLGATTGGPSSGVATLTFTDSTTQTFTVNLSDWTGSGGLAAGDSVAVATTYQDTGDGFTQNTAADLYYTAPVTVPAGKALASVTLPTSVTHGALHVFSLAAIPPSPAYTNEGVCPTDGGASTANFDAAGGCYSNAALTAAGFAPHASVTVANVAFTWPGVTNGANDNWGAAGQVIPLPAVTGGVIGFLGAAAGGVSSGTATITYTDGSTQPFTLTLSDWLLSGGLASGNQVAAQMAYHDTASGGTSSVTTDVFLTSVTLQPGKTPFTVQLPASVSGGVMHVFAVGALPVATAYPPPSGPPPAFNANDWRGYLHDTARSGYDGAEKSLTVANYGTLTQKWAAKAGGSISDQPAVVNGVSYWGSWDGLLHATSSSGASLWTANLGQTTDASCDPPTVGIGSSPAVGSVYGVKAVLVGGGDGHFYAVNARNGAILWSTELGTTPSHFLWSSPLIFNGDIYEGLASFGDCPLIAGGIVKMNENTGAVEQVFHTVPASCQGVSVWGSIAVDSATGALFFATGNAGPCAATEGLAESVVSVRASNFTLLGSWQIPNQATGGDIDFGTTTTLFTATINGQQHALVGAVNKDGVYYAFDRSNIGAGPVWSRQIGTGGDCPQCGGGDIAPAAFDGTTLYVGSGNVTLNGVACTGSVRALDPATGQSRWDVCLTTGSVLGALTATPGVVIATAGARVQAYNASTGAMIWSFIDPTGGYFYAPAAVSNGRVFVGNIDGLFYCFGLPGSMRPMPAQRLPLPPRRPAPARYTA